MGLHEIVRGWTVALLAMLAFGGEPCLAQAKSQEQVGCIVCHGAEGKQFKSSVHSQVELRCIDCHGGDPAPLEKAAAHGSNLITGRDARSSVELCSSCHSDAGRMRGTGLRTDQQALYATSQHGLQLAQDASAQVATCVTCHNSHAVYRSTDPRSPIHKQNQPETCGKCHSDPAVMEAFGHSTMIAEEYQTSVHGRALLEQSHMSSPSCTSCHGSHGAAPPGYETVGRVCGECHSVVLRYFEESPHNLPSKAGKLEECTSCHGFHAITEPTTKMLAEPGGMCAQCHGEADAPALQVGSKLFTALTEFDDSILDAEEEIHSAGLRGFFMDREHGYLEEARSLRARARSLTHTLSVEELQGLLIRGQGMVDLTHESLRVKARTFRDRKIFTTIFLGVTLLLAGVLQTYRREIFGSLLRQGSGPGGGRRDG